MRRALLLLCALLAAGTARAQDEADERSGYAFDAPRVLAQQRIFGLTHGIRLLALACRSLPGAAATDAAYAAWRARQGAAIAAAVAEISAYYFGHGTADWQSLAQKLSLKDGVDYAPDSPELAAACATLPAALTEARYDLAARLRTELQAAGAATP